MENNKEIMIPIFDKPIRLAPKNVKLLKEDLNKMIWSINIKGIIYHKIGTMEEENHYKKYFCLTILQLLEHLNNINDKEYKRIDIKGYSESVFNEYFELLSEINDVGVLLYSEKEYKNWLNTL